MASDGRTLQAAAGRLEGDRDEALREAARLQKLLDSADEDRRRATAGASHVPKSTVE